MVLKVCENSNCSANIQEKSVVMERWLWSPFVRSNEVGARTDPKVYQMWLSGT